MKALRWAAGLLGCWLVGALAQPPAQAAREVAPGVFVLAGEHAPWGAAHTHVANTGFVLGERCAAVVDSGGSPAHGRALLAALRQVSALPVCWLVLTHAHPDHALGGEAFATANGGRPPEVAAHAKFAAAMAARLPYYQRSLQREGAAAPDRIEPPALAVAVGAVRELDLGGRVLRLQAWPTAHTDNDLTVLDLASGTLWLGDLAFDGHLPVLDGRLQGWQAVLADLARLPGVRRAVPGHGRVSQDWPAALQPTAGYLGALRREVEAALDAGRSLEETLDNTRWPEGWLLAQDFHRRNVTTAYAELEWTR